MEDSAKQQQANSAFDFEAKALRNPFASEYAVFYLTIVYFLALAPFTPGFASAENAANIFSNLLPLLIVALGQTVVLIAGGIDLSAPSTIALSSVLGALVMSSDQGWLGGHRGATAAGIAVMLSAGAVVGLFNGAAITWLRMPAFIVTLTTMMFTSGLAIWLTKSKTIYNLPPAFNAIGKSALIVAPYALVIAGGLHVLLTRSLYGRWLYATGHNARAAEVAGVPVKRTITLAYVISGLCAAAAAILYTGRMETGSPVLGQRMLLDVIGAAVIGGTSLFGGKGKVVWTLGGVLFITLLDNSLNLLGLSYFSVMMVKGVVILLAALLDAWRNRLNLGTQRLRRADSAADASMPEGLPLIECRPQPSPHAGGAAYPGLQLTHIEKSFFGVPVLRGVSLQLKAGRILGLVGENGAGKSTLMNILGGVLAADAGAMSLDGERYAPRNPAEAQARGVTFIHQELNLFTNLSIAENLFINDFPQRGFVGLNRRAMHEQTRALLNELELRSAPETLVETLSPGERQLVEIAKALSSAAKIIILDEPTTSLTTRETERLFALLARLRAQGIALIYISHNLGDVRRLCDDIVVLRDGAVVGAGDKNEFTEERMIALMVGRSLEQLFPPRAATTTQAVALEAKGLSQPGVLEDVSFRLHKGEVLGVAGLMGAGRTELARALFGLDAVSSGAVFINDQPAPPTPRGRIQCGMALLTEDRRAEGLLMEASVADNVALAALPAYVTHVVPASAGSVRKREIPAEAGTTCGLRMLDQTALASAVQRVTQTTQLKGTANLQQAVKTLSGGNQQKAVLARWLLTEPSVFVLDEPTRGIDVGAKAEIYRLINELAERGAGVLLISSEIEELIGMCDRVLVMAAGRITDSIERAEFDRERILRAALGKQEANA